MLVFSPACSCQSLNLTLKNVSFGFVFLGTLTRTNLDDLITRSLSLACAPLATTCLWLRKESQTPNLSLFLTLSIPTGTWIGPSVFLLQALVSVSSVGFSCKVSLTGQELCFCLLWRAPLSGGNCVLLDGNGWQCSHTVLFHRQGWTRLAAGVYGVYDQQGDRKREIQRGDRECFPCPQLRREALRDQGGALPGTYQLWPLGTDRGFLFIDS